MQQKQLSKIALLPFYFMEPHWPLCQLGTTQNMMAVVKFSTGRDKQKQVNVWSLPEIVFDMQTFPFKSVLLQIAL